MLGLVLCLGRDGAQHPKFFLMESRLRILWIIMIGYMTHWLDGCDHTWVYLFDPSWMAAPIPWIQIIAHSVSDGYVHTTSTSCTWDISCIFLRRFFRRRTFSWTCSRKAFHPSPSRASYFRGHLLHSNLSPSLPFPIPHNGGPILWPVNIVMPWKHHQCIPLNMSFICPWDISLRKSWKTSLLALARASSSVLAPMEKLMQRGRATWRSVIEP